MLLVQNSIHQRRSGVAELISEGYPITTAYKSICTDGSHKGGNDKRYVCVISANWTCSTVGVHSKHREARGPAHASKVIRKVRWEEMKNGCECGDRAHAGVKKMEERGLGPAAHWWNNPALILLWKRNRLIYLTGTALDETPFIH